MNKNEAIKEICKILIAYKGSEANIQEIIQKTTVLVDGMDMEFRSKAEPPIEDLWAKWTPNY